MEEPLTILYTANLRGDLERLPRLHTFLRQLKNQRPADEPDVMLCAVEPVARRILLLDAGNACALDTWHCAATGGRSALIVLDAMGYQAANVAGFLTAEGRARLDANYLGIALVDEAHPWQSGDVVVACGTGLPTEAESHPSEDNGSRFQTTDDLNDQATSPIHGAYTPSSRGISSPGGSLRIVLPPSASDALVGAKRASPAPENPPDLRPSPVGEIYLPPVEALQVGVIHVAWANHVPVIQARTVLDMPPNTPPDPTITSAVEFVLAEARRLGR